METKKEKNKTNHYVAVGKFTLDGELVETYRSVNEAMRNNNSYIVYDILYKGIRLPNYGFTFNKLQDVFDEKTIKIVKKRYRRNNLTDYQSVEARKDKNPKIPYEHIFKNTEMKRWEVIDKAIDVITVNYYLFLNKTDNKEYQSNIADVLFNVMEILKYAPTEHHLNYAVRFMHRTCDEIHAVFNEGTCWYLQQIYKLALIKLKEFMFGNGKTVSKPRTKRVRQYDKEGKFIKEWESIKEASIKTTTSKGGISLCCQGFQQYSGGYIWRYAN